VSSNFRLLSRNLLLIIVFLFNSYLVLANDKEHNFNSNGCIQFDHIFWKGDKSDDFLSGAILKSTDVYVKGFLGEGNLDYFMHFSFLDTFRKSNLSEAFIEYSSDNFVLKIGQMIFPFGLEDATYINNRMFMESSLLKNMVDNRYFGLSGEIHCNHYTVLAAIVVPELSENFSKTRSNKYSFLFRNTINLFKRDNSILHMGLSYKLIKKHYNETSPSSSLAFKDVPSFNTINSLLSSHSSILPRYYMFGVEIAGVWNSLFMQSEYVSLNASWKDYEKEKYSCWYVQFSYMLTGEAKVYNVYNGSFQDPIPQSLFGAFELVARYSHIDLLNNGALLRGISTYDGKKDAVTFGVNWLVNKFLKLQINYAYEEFKYRIPDNRKISGIGARIQFLF